LHSAGEYSTTKAVERMVEGLTETLRKTYWQQDHWARLRDTMMRALGGVRSSPLADPHSDRDRGGTLRREQGTDDNDGLTAETPLRTIHPAIEKCPLAAGCGIYL
jgi:hypothetical protein